MYRDARLGTIKYGIYLFNLITNVTFYLLTNINVDGKIILSFKKYLPTRALENIFLTERRFNLDLCSFLLWYRACIVWVRSGLRWFGLVPRNGWSCKSYP